MRLLILILPTLAFACPSWDPVNCGPDELLCPGSVDPEGCAMPDFCEPNTGFENCPGICPTMCPPDKIQCWGGFDSNGCLKPDTCIPLEGPIGNNGNACISTCPMVCAQGQMLCPGGLLFSKIFSFITTLKYLGFDFNGCEMPGICMPANGPGNCPQSCPTFCGPNEIQCWGGFDSNGCSLSDSCIPMKGPMGTNGMECPSFCPISCPPNMSTCPGAQDEFGCTGPEYCDVSCQDDTSTNNPVDSTTGNPEDSTTGNPENTSTDPIPESDPTFCLDQGACYRGSWMVTDSGNRFAAFQGIKYAEDPVGNLRFKPPQPFNAGQGFYDVSYNPDISCTQEVAGWIFGQEDCLILNVYVPESAISNKLPVMVWIHGGGLRTGGSTFQEYGPQKFMDNQVVLVTLNYRLGIFGFLNLGNDEVPGNAGFKDQNLALKWVNENIGSFYGDSEEITIFGESAGAHSVNIQMLSPKSQGLFKRAILQSGSSLLPWSRPLSQEIVQRKTSQVLQQLGCPSDNALGCLQFKPAFELAYQNSIATFATIDGDFIPSDAKDLLEFGQFDTSLEVLIGTTKDDGMLEVFQQLSDGSWSGLSENWDFVGPMRLFGIPFGDLITDQDVENARKVAEFYFGSVENLNEENKQAVIEMFTDASFAHGGFR